jgi:putative pyruvate formate lyase activating enzyme
MASYLALSLAELKERAQQAVNKLADCTVCPRECHVNRLQEYKGYCRGGREAVVSSWGPHFGEETVLVGQCGSGTIFFTYCNLACCFCQNYVISQYGEGRAISSERLSRVMLELQDTGCHNINFVSPSHYVPQILEALVLAVTDGLKVPLVYNSGGYDAIPTLRLLDGIVDIYMPDLKYGDDQTAEKYSRAPRYFTVAKEAVKEMHRQVGDLQVNEQGIATRGLLVRHLVLPQGLAGTEAVMNFLAAEISPHTFINVMKQYYPAHEAKNYPELSRRISPAEHIQAINMAREANLRRIYT